jgi:hypothetical protein
LIKKGINLTNKTSWLFANRKNICFSLIFLVFAELAFSRPGDCSGGPCISGAAQQVVVSGSVGGALAGGWAALAGKGAMQIVGYVLLGGIAGPVVFIATVVAIQELTVVPPPFSESPVKLAQTPQDRD